MNEKATKFLLAFSLPAWKYDQASQAEQKARIGSGYTSLRITKQTLADLQELRKNVGELQRNQQRSGGGYGYSSYGNLSMDDMLTRIATGNLGLSSSFVAPKPAAAKPAKKARRKVRP
jgi:hypothetical protein